jgi:segregation and condensation protein B
MSDTEEPMEKGEPMEPEHAPELTDVPQKTAEPEQPAEREAAVEPAQADAPNEAEEPKRSKGAKRSKQPKQPESPADPEPLGSSEAPVDPELPEDVGSPTEESLPLEVVEGGIALKRVAEALVFASPKPITTKDIVAALKAAAGASEDPQVQALGKAKANHVIAALGEVQAELVASARAFQLVEKVSGWVLVSDPACAAWVRQLYPEAKPTRLTGPQLETLAIIAYRQPVTRADIEAVRGVSVDGVMQVLLDRSLVKIAGRAEVPGRPLLYSTTDYFLEHFGLKNTDELPNATELKRVVLPTAPIAEEPKPAETPDAATTEAPSATAAEPPVEEAPAAAPEPAEESAPADVAPEATSADEPPTEESVDRPD